MTKLRSLLTDSLNIMLMGVNKKSNPINKSDMAMAVTLMIDLAKT